MGGNCVPADQFEGAVKMFGDGSARFHPVAAIHIKDWSNLSCGCLMDMAAYHDLRALMICISYDGFFKGANEIDGLFHL